MVVSSIEEETSKKISLQLVLILTIALFVFPMNEDIEEEYYCLIVVW